MSGNNFRSDRLEELIHTYGLTFNENIKWDNEKMIKLLGDYFIDLEPNKYSWGTRYVQSLATPMLCKHMKDDLSKFKVSPLESKDYVAETKLNGSRTLVVYSPEVGFEFFSRRESSLNYLNNNLTDKFLFIEKGLISEPKDYKGKFNYRFVLDGELLIEGIENEIKTTQVSIEDYIQSVFSSKAERAREFQKDGHRLKVMIFDVLYFEKNPQIPANWNPRYDYIERELTTEAIQWVEEHFYNYLRSACFTGIGRAKKLYQYLYSLKFSNENDIRKLPFYKRRKLRTLLINMLKKAVLPFYEVEGEDENKIEFTENILKDGAEGCFKSSCQVTMADGTLKQIRNIKENDVVLSYNTESRKLEPKKVIRKIDNGLRKSTEWLSVSHGALQKDKVASKQNRFHRIICTKNHNFYNGENYSPIENLNYCYELGYELDSYRYHALLGWLLSDGTIDKNGVICLCQKESSPFWKFTTEMFKFYTSKGCNKTFVSGKGSKIGRLYINKEHCLSFTEFRKNKISYIKQLNEISIAYLIMGDGSKSNNALNISTHSMSEEEINALLNQMKILFGDIEYSLKKDKRVKHGSGMSIYLYTKTANKIKEKISKYIHPSMRYKLGDFNCDNFKEPPIVAKSIKKVPLLKNNIDNYVNFKGKNKHIRAWDLEVEDNHNFFVENVLVHNSIIKNIHAPYISDLRSSRNHRAAMKVKQSISKMLNSNFFEDFDVFITGANPPKSDKITNMIGSLSCSIYVHKKDGSTVEHEIANITGISHAWKKKLTSISEDGKITLNPDYLYKVIAIDGLALTGSNLKFQHATLKSKNLDFKDKNPTECTWEEDTLKEMVLTRGK